MEQTALTYLCPDCMAYLRYDGKEQKWVCDYCGGKFTREELEQRGTETKQDDYEVKPRAEAAENTAEIFFRTSAECKSVKDQEFLKTFSFICLLSFDVYVKKQLIESLIDDLHPDTKEKKKK